MVLEDVVVFLNLATGNVGLFGSAIVTCRSPWLSRLSILNRMLKLAVARHPT